MSQRPFRFLHASDFHLQTPLSGVAEMPEHLVELFLEAAYWSAERVFETALAEQVDFVVLSGDLVDSRQAGPRGPLFLLEQFGRLAERKIGVYWAGGRVDPPGAWPPSLRLPPNVHIFPKGQPEEQVFHRGDSPVARLVGASRPDRGRIPPASFEPQEPGPFAIAVANGQVEVEAARAGRIDYWALGGRPSRMTPSESMPVVHYPGSPQGRQPDETGPRGCTLVQVDSQRRVQMSFVPTDAMRWQQERVLIEPAATRQTLESLLDARICALAESAAGIDQLVSWTIVGDGRLVRELRRGPLAGELLERLRKEHGHGSPVLWSVSLAAEPATPLAPDAFKEETIRGDFLRRLEELAADPAVSLGLDSLLAEASLPESLDLVPEGDGRLAVLREAAVLGVDLLSPEEPES